MRRETALSLHRLGHDLVATTDERLLVVEKTCRKQGVFEYLLGDERGEFGVVLAGRVESLDELVPGIDLEANLRWWWGFVGIHRLHHSTHLSSHELVGIQGRCRTVHQSLTCLYLLEAFFANLVLDEVAECRDSLIGECFSLLRLLAVPQFEIGPVGGKNFLHGFTATMASLIVGSLLVAFLLLAPSIVLGYAVKAADRADAEQGW